MDSKPKPIHPSYRPRTSDEPIPIKPKRETIAVTHPNLYAALKDWEHKNLPEVKTPQNNNLLQPQNSIQQSSKALTPDTLSPVDSSMSQSPSPNALWNEEAIVSPNPTAEQSQDDRQVFDQQLAKRTTAHRKAASEFRLAVESFVISYAAVGAHTTESEQLQEQLNAKNSQLETHKAFLAKATAHQNKSKSVAAQKETETNRCEGPLRRPH